MKSFRWILVLVLRWPLHTPSSEVARSVQKCEVANCWGAGARILGSRRNLIAGGGISQPRYFTKRCWFSWFTIAGVTMRGLLAPARGQCQVSPWPLSGHSSSNSGSSKAIKEQMILLLLLHVTMHVNENKHGQLAIFWCSIFALVIKTICREQLFQKIFIKDIQFYLCTFSFSIYI